VGVASSDIHPAAREPSGTITILTGDFDKLRRGDEVYYVEDVGDTGPLPTKVRVKGEQYPPHLGAKNTHRTAMMNSRGNRSSTLPSNRGL